jgi:enamine deaminase RidA (YjgF/YER057c/UK114 family)
MKSKLLLFIVLFLCFQSSFSQKIENRLAELKIILPKVQPPIASYVNAVRTGNLIYLSGKGPTSSDGKFISGKVGVDLTLEEGKAAARNTGLNLLAALKAEIGDLDKVKRIVKVLGMVNCPTDFTQQPQVINGFSDLMVEVFGDKGKHARSAIGVGSLPANMAVEIEMIVEVE